MFDYLKQSVSGANKALSDASKAWRDENLAAREAEMNERQSALYERQSTLSKREQEVSEGLERIGRWESRRGLRTFGFISSVVIAIAVGFILGGISGSSNSGDELDYFSRRDGKPVAVARPSEPEVDTEKKSPERQGWSDPYTAANEGRYGRGNDFNIGYYCLDVEATGDFTFEECLGAGVMVLSNH